LFLIKKGLTEISPLNTSIKVKKSLL